MRRGPDRFVRYKVWGPLKVGDEVLVSGTTAHQKRRPRWTFAAYVFDRKTGGAHVEVIGGKPGHLLNRAFAPDRVRPAQGTRRGASQ